MSNKIFVLGYNKTGTMSLERALTILGYKVLHTRGGLLKGSMYIFQYNLHMQKNILTGIDWYDCYLDYPIYEPTVFSHIVHEHPDAKYISLTRNLDDYVEAVLGDKIKRLKQGSFDNWNWLGVGDEEVFKNYPDYQKQWIKGRAEFKHDSNISLLFKNNINYLDMNICDNGDGWEKLCKFLDKEIPNVDFPYKNKGIKM
jgi:hypothetical protein|tara:strand:+ start:2789 stop:3385 length:597 start_codon:yes stop_codon:yes gene_type:complete